MIIKLLGNFETVGSIGMKLSGVARLVPSNFWWVVPRPSPHLVVLGLHPVLPEGEQLCGPWCYRVMSYHFGKFLSSPTTLFNQIFVFESRPGIAGVKRGAWKGRVIFLRIS